MLFLTLKTCCKSLHFNLKKLNSEDSWFIEQQSNLSFAWVLPGDEQRNHGAILLALLFHVLQDVWEKQ